MARRRPKPNTTQAGYGAEHQKLRKEWAPKVEAGYVACRRCRRLIAPGSAWHLGHHDDRSLPPEPEHALCNVRTATWAAQGRAIGTNRPSPETSDAMRAGYPNTYELCADGRWRPRVRSRDW